MIQITSDNVHKILDIDESQISGELKSAIRSVTPVYQDNEEDLNEHLYSWDEVLYSIREELGPADYQQLIQIAEVCNENEITYIRIIKTM